MIGGGRHHETTGAWLVKVRNLRPGDRIELENWNGTYWHDGEPMVVTSEPDAIDGDFYSLWAYAEECTSHIREYYVRPDDEVKICSRELREKPVEVSVGDGKRKKRPKKGQLSLF